MAGTISEGTISNKEEMDGLPQNFPHLLLILKAKMFKAIEKENFIGYSFLVSTHHHLLSPFHDDIYKSERKEITARYEKKRKEVEMNMRSVQTRAIPSMMQPASIQSSNENIRILIYESNEILGALSRLESRKNLLLPVTTTILEEDPDE